MQAVRIHEHGDVGILQYESAPEPKPKIGEVLVQVKAAAMNHLDLWVRRGIPGVPLPMILGSDGAGIIFTFHTNCHEIPFTSFSFRNIINRIK